LTRIKIDVGVRVAAPLSDRMLAAVSEVPDLTFDALARADPSCSTLAYWLGPCDTKALEGADAVGMSRAMSLQYDIEDQADRTGTVIADDIWWRDYFAPIAPVQLTRRWSPLPYAVAVLGPPGWVSVEPDVLGLVAAACAWTGGRSGPLLADPEDSADQLRFRELLGVAMARAHESNRAVVVTTKPGWSYDRSQPPSGAGRRLMEEVGFVVQDRRPPA
jgi:hypothetical protein